MGDTFAHVQIDLNTLAATVYRKGYHITWGDRLFRDTGTWLILLTPTYVGMLFSTNILLYKSYKLAILYA